MSDNILSDTTVRATAYHPVHDFSADEIIRTTRRELANRYGSRGTTEQLRRAIVVLDETARGAA
jgi:hypothetical protein